MTAGGGEWGLVEAAKAGDREAFGRLYARYVGEVSRFVGSRVRDHVVVEDLTSETFFRALRRIDSVTDQGKAVGAWLTTIARNLVFDHVKSSCYRREYLVEEVRNAGSEREGPECVVIRRDTAETVRRSVDALPVAVARCVRLRFFDELSVAETAATMGRTQGAVKALTHRGLAALRASLPDEAGPGVSDSVVAARQAVARLRARQTARQRDTAEAQRSNQVARWHAEDQASEASTELVAGHGVSGASTINPSPGDQPCY